MGALQTDDRGMRTLAAQCERLADELAIPSVPEIEGLSCQPTAYALRAVDDIVAAAGQTFAERMAAVSVKLSDSANSFANRDIASADDIRASRL